MKYIYHLIVIILVLTTSNCETTADANDLLDTSQLIVINGYLAPQDDIIKIQVSKSQSRAKASSSDPEKLVITNAVVSLKNETQTEIFLNYNTATLNYEVNANLFPIEAGKQYYLNVIVNDNVYTSNCKIPVNKATNINETIAVINDDYLFWYDFNLDFDDPENHDNFYIAGVKRITTTTAETEEQSLLEDIDKFTTDFNKDGLTISIKSTIYEKLENGDSLRLQVANTEKILYTALRSSFLNTYNEGNPFSDPIILPNNIEGENGYGIFAGYQLTEKEVIYNE